MAKKQIRKKENSGPFWRIVITTVGISLIFLAVLNITLYFFGESTTADVSVRRVGGSNDNYPPSKRYEWSIDYTFKDDTGQVFSGHTVRRSGDIGIAVEKTIFYFTFAPFLNALENDVKPNIGQIVLIATGLLVIIAVNKKKKNMTRRVNGKMLNETKASTDLYDYDDSVENSYHNKK